MVLFLRYGNKIIPVLISLGVRITRFHRVDRGSSPRWGKTFLSQYILYILHNIIKTLF